MPGRAGGVVLLVRGVRSRRRRSQISAVADALRQAGFAALAVDLPAHEEQLIGQVAHRPRTDVTALAGRVTAIVDRLAGQPGLASRPIGLFGISTAGSAALVAAVERPGAIRAIVSLGAGPDLALAALPWVSASTLLIVGDRDEAVVELNREAMGRLGGTTQLEIVSGMTCQFDSVNRQVAELATSWFLRHVGTAPASSRSRAWLNQGYSGA